MTSKAQYLIVRQQIILGQFNDSVMNFLQQFCTEEKRDINILMFILNKANEYGFVGDLLQKLVRYLDGKYEIIKVIRVKDKQILTIC